MVVRVDMGVVLLWEGIYISRWILVWCCCRRRYTCQGGYGCGAVVGGDIHVRVDMGRQIHIFSIITNYYFGITKYALSLPTIVNESLK